MDSTRSQGETQIFCQKTQHGVERSMVPCRSKVERFKQCTYIEIKDFGALQHLVRDHSLSKISKMPGPRFPAVKYVALGEALIRVVGLENDQHNQTFVEVLVEMFSPVHLCVFYSRGATDTLLRSRLMSGLPRTMLEDPERGSCRLDGLSESSCGNIDWRTESPTRSPSSPVAGN
jgi:hypothetical protein